MKLGTLRAITHNIADALGSRSGILNGVYEIDVFVQVGSFKSISCPEKRRTGRLPKSQGVAGQANEQGGKQVCSSPGYGAERTDTSGVLCRIGSRGPMIECMQWPPPVEDEQPANTGAAAWRERESQFRRRWTTLG
jgi:hypothetical protein